MAILEITKWRLFLTLLAVVSVYALTRLAKAGASFARPGRLNPLASLPEQKRRALLENRQLFMALLAVNWQLRQHSDDKALLDRKRELEAALAARANPSIRKDMRHLRWRAFVEAARHGPGLPTIALVLVTGWMLTRSAGDLALLLAWSGAVALVVIYLPDAVNLIMRFGFGYLRRPFRALVTLALVMLAGWWGVATANEARMLVVSVTPVATLVGEANGQIAIGGQLVPVTPSTNIATNVQCGDTISEPLYALDVLIPLIDLHQESLCEVAIAELPRLNRNLHQGSFDTVVHSTTFWLVAKAAYAILGWIVISLTILTFVRVFRTGEAS